MRTADIIIFSILIGIIATLASGYSYGTDDGISDIPIINRAIDASYLTNDFYTNVSAEFGPRFYFARIIAALSRIASLPYLYLILTFISNISVAMITAFFARDIFGKSGTAGMLAACLVMSIATFELGTADFVYAKEMHPIYLAMPLLLLSIWAGFRKYPIVSALLAGGASIFHPTFGLEVGALVIFIMFAGKLLGDTGHGSANREISYPGLIGASIILSAFAALWVIPYSFMERIDPLQLISIEAYFRHPHHEVPSTFLKLDYLEGVTFLTAATISGYWWQKQRRNSRQLATHIMILAGTILILCAGGYVFVEVYPSRIWTIARPFRLLILLKWLGLVFIGGTIARFLRSQRREGNRFDVYLFLIGVLSPVSMAITHVTRLIRTRARDRLRSVGALFESGPMLIIVAAVIFIFLRPGIRMTLLFLTFVCAALFMEYYAHRRLRRAVIVTVTGLALVNMFLGKGILPSKIDIAFDKVRPHITLSHHSGDLADMARYARENTPDNTVFLTPPMYGTFRLVAERAIVVDFKAFPFGDKAMVEWQRRLFDCYGIPNSSGFEAAFEMDDNYRNIDDLQLCSLQPKYRFSYAVLYNKTLTTLPVIYENDTYKLVLL